MKLTFISDTHSLHTEMPAIPPGDILVHCGDFTGYGTYEDMEDFAAFMARQSFTHKIVIAGNHDSCFEDRNYEAAEECLRDYGLIYLNDSGTEVEGIKFWGSPVQPIFFNWSFNRQRGPDIRRHWNKIPNDTDVLLTHGPAFGILDRQQVGCEDLLQAVLRVKPKIHACGHIHEAYGIEEHHGTIFVNACILDGYYQLANQPIEVVM